MLHRVLLLLAGGFILAQAGLAQDPNHLDRISTPITYPTLETWEARAAWLRDHIRVSAGLDPMPERHPLTPTFSRLTRGDGYTVQSVALKTHPGFYLTGTLYRPAAGEGPFPAILSPHGHWHHGRFEHTDVASIPARAITFARQGFVVLTYSMIGYNETENLFPHRFDDPRYQLWGFSALGLQLWNSLRALDFIAGLPEVDVQRIGMTGASGGGTQTFLLTAIDPRIAAAAPVNMISAHFQGGCICENGPSMRLDATNIDIAALAAPRPLLMVSTAGDWTVNTPNIEYPAIQAIYRLHQAEEQVANVHFGYPHNYNRPSRDVVYDWFTRWLEPSLPALREASALTLLPADTTGIALPGPMTSPEALFEHLRAEAELAWQTPPADEAGLRAYRDRFETAYRHALFAPAPWEDRLMYFAPTPPDPASQAVLIVHDGHPEQARLARSLARQHQIQGHLAAVLTPYPAGDGFVPPDSIAYWTTYNASVPSFRVAEIQGAIEALRAHPGITRLELVGLGEAGVWGLLARGLAGRVDAATLHMNGVGYSEDQDFLDHLPIPLLRRAGDLRTAVALAAPAPLTLTHIPPGALADWIRRLYQQLGAEDHLVLEPLR